MNFNSRNKSAWCSCLYELLDFFKQSKNERLKTSEQDPEKHITPESSCLKLMISNHQYPISSRNGNYNMRKMSSSDFDSSTKTFDDILNCPWIKISYNVTYTKLTDLNDDHLHFFNEMRAKYGMPPLNLKKQNASYISDDESKNVDQVNSDLNASQQTSFNISHKSMKRQKESPATDSQDVSVLVSPRTLNNELKKLESVASISTKKNTKRKKSDAINKPNIPQILQDEERDMEKEKIKKKEKFMKMVAKFEEKEEKKLMKHLEKIKASLIAKKQGQLNDTEKKFIATVENEAKLLDMMKLLKCKNQRDALRFLKYFGVKVPRKNSLTNRNQIAYGCSSNAVKMIEIKPSGNFDNPSANIIEQKCKTKCKRRGRKITKSKFVPADNIHCKETVKEEVISGLFEDQISSTSKREANLTCKSKSLDLSNSFNNHKSKLCGDLFTDMSMITDETFTIECPCGEMNCVTMGGRFHPDLSSHHREALRFLKYFGVKVPRENSVPNRNQIAYGCSSNAVKMIEIKPSGNFDNPSANIIEQKCKTKCKRRGRKITKSKFVPADNIHCKETVKEVISGLFEDQISSTSEREANLAYETFTIECPCGEMNCVTMGGRFHPDLSSRK
ncbi:hypothetical protein NPIL_307331 [Nephila pilipes]|uniref:Uncharacterized protein n=1 Tax=Nephila pilipes TaxID=299642 RepID=A0A8X6J0B9_NEPPI|nr:hypothetical protein NPIL_307331 [Nephila pilipes]